MKLVWSGRTGRAGAAAEAAGAAPLAMTMGAAAEVAVEVQVVARPLMAVRGDLAPVAALGFLRSLPLLPSSNVPLLEVLEAQAVTAVKGGRASPAAQVVPAAVVQVTVVLVAPAVTVAAPRGSRPASLRATSSFWTMRV